MGSGLRSCQTQTFAVVLGARASIRCTRGITTPSGACRFRTTSGTSSSSLLESAQAGLSWWTILRKREGYRRAFADFDPAQGRALRRSRGERLMQDAGIVRNRQKIEAAIGNARGFLEIQEEFGSFDAYVWPFVGGEPIMNRWRVQSDIPATTQGVRRAEQGPEEARVQVRRLDDRLCAHAGDRPRQRPSR